MKCVNCGLAIQRLQRHLVSSLSARHQSRLSCWLSNAQTQLPLDALICQPCFLLLDTEAGEHERLLGHTMVCVGCGKSVRRIRHHNVNMECPLLAVLISQNTDYVPTRNNYICRVCWMRANRQAVVDSTRDMQELASDQQEEIVVKTENADELLIETEESYPDVRVQGVADLRYHDKEVQTKPDVDHRGVQANPIRYRSKAVQYNTDTPPKITILKLVKKETEKMMLSVYEYLCEELEMLRLMSAEQVLAALAQVSRRAALATGVSERAMQSALDKHKRKKKRKHKTRARTYSHSTDSTDDEQPPLVREPETDSSTSLKVSAQRGTELPDVEMDCTTTNGSRQQQMDCNRGKSMEEGTLLKVISIKEEVHSHDESTDEAIAEEPVIYVKVEPLIDDVDM
ncbi:uncharacterized protein LOC118278823 isoform X2 [Spodoptera frugiperda]|uniref:Uncharacterized protein LOC118278823 isoform X2 n=1 Tax=Spodoptera frugiperda TaxID=7108 RepID=A0A9R0F2N8_SPOFR|nr:uncharacterized protein LOC118278823 isoform X2 [Spodoptera frugiperda]